MQARVSLVANAEGAWIDLEGGAPEGNDAFHKLVSSWPGWRRLPLSGAVNGQPTSRYRARRWLAAMVPLERTKLELSWTDEARAWAHLTLTAFRVREGKLQREVSAERCQPARAGGRRPLPHQVQALDALAEMDGAAILADDMGLGKTTTSILAWHASRLPRLLVVCPKSVKHNWVTELEAVFGDEGRAADAPLPDGVPLVYLIDGTASHRANVLTWMRHVVTQQPEQLAVAVVNYDLLRSMSVNAWDTLQRWVDGGAVICDEFHYCKDIDSARTKAVKTLAHRASLRLGLTGTPVRNTVEDLFALAEVIRPGTWVSYHAFANQHLERSQVQFAPGRRPVEVVRGGKNLQELRDVMATMMIGRKKDQVLTLPPLIRTKPQLELDGVHEEIYQSMKQFAKVELEKLTESAKPESEPITIWNPLARSAVEMAMRCEMIAQGFISGLPEEYANLVAPLIAKHAERVEGYQGAFVFPSSPKMAWLLDAIEGDLKDRQVVILSRFNAPLLWLKKRLAQCEIVIGSMDAVARAQAIADFRDGKHRVLGVQVKLAEGFNLTTATDVIFLGRDWSPAINAQGEARCHRIGTAGTVNVQIPIVRKTVEVFIDKRLAAKDADAQQALAQVTVRELLEAL